MLFSSLEFLFAYLPITLLVYFISPVKFRNLWILLVSLFFYGWGEPVNVFLMIFTIIFDYVCGYFVGKYKDTHHKRAKIILIVSVIVNLGLLGFFKYYNFFVENLNLLPFVDLPVLHDLTLPIGISFYTFQIMSYVIDVYRGDARVQKNPITVGAYVTLFPQLIAGPIVRYQDVDDQLRERRESVAMFASGVRTFVAGLCKKVVFANTAGALWDAALADTNRTVFGSWFGLLFYCFQIYFDFSGYSDMAIGLGKMMGFRFLENFNYPYISRSVTEFWRRWHMSLGTWFKEYVYIPLGGNRVGKLKQYRNIAIVWFLTGFWHGANWNYILWGVYFGVLLMLEKTFLLGLLKKLPKFVGHVYALLLIGFGWIIFSFTDAAAGVNCFLSLFGIGTSTFCTPTVGYQILHSLPLLLIGAVGATPLPKTLWDKFCTTDWTRIGAIREDGFEEPDVMEDTTVLTRRGKLFGVLTSAGTFALLIVCVAYLVDSTFSPFLYFIF